MQARAEQRYKQELGIGSTPTAHDSEAGLQEPAGQLNGNPEPSMNTHGGTDLSCPTDTALSVTDDSSDHQIQESSHDRICAALSMGVSSRIFPARVRPRSSSLTITSTTRPSVEPDSQLRRLQKAGYL